MMNSRDENAAERAGRDLRADFAGLSAEVEKLATEIGRRGRSSGRTAKASAGRGLAALSSRGEDWAEDIGRGYDRVEDRAATALQEHPLRSLGIAALVGFLLAFLLRR